MQTKGNLCVSIDFSHRAKIVARNTPGVKPKQINPTTSVTKYHSGLTRVRRIINKHWDMLRKHPNAEKLFKHPPRITCRRARNIESTETYEIKQESLMTAITYITSSTSSLRGYMEIKRTFIRTIGLWKLHNHRKITYLAIINT